MDSNAKKQGPAGVRNMSLIRNLKRGRGVLYGLMILS